MCDRVLGLHVLVVSADPVVGQMLRERLQTEGAAVSVTDTAGAALEQVHAHRFHAVVVELGLPDMNDDVLLAALATQAHRGMRIAAISRAPGDDLARAIAAGADRVFPTPVDWHRLLWYLETGPVL